MANVMECKEAKKRLSEALDAELGSEEKASLDEHLEECASCRGEQGELQRVVELVGDLAEPAVKVPEPAEAWKRIDKVLGEAAPGDESPFEDQEDEAVLASGAFDIRDMVAASKAAAPGGAAEGRMTSQDFFGLSDGASGEAAPAAVAPPPVLMPVAQRPAWLVPVFVAGGVLVLSVLALGVVLFVREGRKPKSAPEEKIAQATESEKKTASREQPALSGKAKDLSTQPAPATADSAAGKKEDPLAAARPEDAMASGNGATAAAGGSSGPAKGRVGYRHRGRRVHGYGGASPADKTPRSIYRRPRPRPRARLAGSRAATPARPRATFSDDPLSALLKARKAREAPRPSGPKLAHNLTRGQIRSVMARAAGSVKKCFERHKQPGLMRVSIAIKGSTGRVASASVRGKFKGTATARCALRTIRRLKFPKFGMVTQRFTYPFLLR